MVSLQSSSVSAMSRSKPNMSPIKSSGSGAAMSHTKSHAPRSQTWSMISLQIARM